MIGPNAVPARFAKNLLLVEDLHMQFRVPKALGFGHDRLRALDGISFGVNQGETLGLVGESGCGKSTLGRTILGLHKPSKGAVYLDGKNLVGMSDRERRPYRRQMQIVFQDPYASLDPRMTVHDIIAEPLRINSQYNPNRVAEVLQRVGLTADAAIRYAAAFSGGQRQRIAIARALALNPRLLILDEPVSALDVSIQAQIINLLKQLQRELQLTYLFISHDLSVVRHISHRVAVMYLGRIVEIGSREMVFSAPAHPYTQSLLSDVPIPDPSQRRSRKRRVLPGEPPNPLKPPSGCVFRSRCFKAQPECAQSRPALAPRTGEAHFTACFLAEATGRTLSPVPSL